MSNDPAFVFKVVVTGPFSAGKTTFIQTIVDREFVTTAAATTSSDETDVKHSTTTGMDFGVLTLEDPGGDIELRVYGTPGQERFSFMWEVLGEGADAFVLLVNGTEPASWEASRAHLAVMERLGNPGVIGVNRGTDADVAEAQAFYADVGIVVPVLACNATDQDQVRDLLVTALVQVLEAMDAPEPDHTTVPTGADA